MLIYEAENEERMYCWMCICKNIKRVDDNLYIKNDFKGED